MPEPIEIVIRKTQEQSTEQAGEEKNKKGKENTKQKAIRR